MTLPTVQAYTLQQFINEVKVEIYKRIQSDHEGEMTEDDFDEIVCDIKTEELDDAINIMYKDEVDRLLCEYGISEAFDLYANNYGWERANPPNTKAVLFAVTDSVMNHNYHDYLDWCGNACECDSECDCE